MNDSAQARPAAVPAPVLPSVSLKTRLRVFIILLMISVVSALSALYLKTISWRAFESIREDATKAAQQTSDLVRVRVNDLMIEQDLQPAPAELKRTWARLIAEDSDIQAFLLQMRDATPGVIEMLIADGDGVIIASTTPSRVGKHGAQLSDFEQWLQRSTFRKLLEIFSQTRDYEVTVAPLGFAEQPRIFIIKVILSSIFLRGLVFPQVQSVLLIFLGALLLSMVLSVVVSNLALRPLQQISTAIDQIARGELAPAPPDVSGREFAAVQSKLNLLGQQYHGARQDAIQLRSNVEQLLESLEEIVLLFDRDDKLVMAGRAAERLIGHGRWELMGRTLTELFPVTTPLGAAVRNAIDLRQPLKDLTLTLERNGGSQGRVLVNVEPLESFPEHKRIGTLITLRDAETRRQIQSHLDVSARLAAISRLTGGVAHEIKNPLQAITVHLEVLKARLAGQDDVAPAIETIAREIQRLDRVVKTFLDFTRPIDLRMREFEMVSLARDVAGLVEPSAARRSVHIDFEAETPELLVHGDRDLIQQAILNVVVNGVESMKEGGRLGIRVQQVGDDCQVSISDEGVGIPPEIRDKIFNLYYSTKGKGSGIGLAMTFRVVQLHNGTIDFSSEPGKGTTFRVRFPVVRSGAAPAREPTPLTRDQPTAADGRA